MNAFTKVPHFQPLTRALLRASQRMKTNEEIPDTYSALALCVQHGSIGPDELNLKNRKQDRHEAGEQAWPNLSRQQGSDQPGSGDTQRAWLLRWRADRKA